MKKTSNLFRCLAVLSAVIAASELAGAAPYVWNVASPAANNWNVNANANDVEFGTGGGSGNTTSDPAFGDASMRPKVAGYAAANNPQLPHAVSIVPAPGTIALLGLGGLLGARRRRS